MSHYATSGSASAIPLEQNSNLYEIRNRIQDAAMRLQGLTARLYQKNCQLVSMPPEAVEAGKGDAKTAARVPLIAEINLALIGLEVSVGELSEQVNVTETI